MTAADIGGRDEQQDSCTALQNTHSTFLVLADGMGGHHGGATASQTLVEEATKAHANHAERIADPAMFFQSIVTAAVEALQRYRAAHPRSDPHTTCVFALIQESTLCGAHIGDSRLYLFDEKRMIHRTKDHSVVQMLVNLGEIEAHEMATHPDQNRLLRSIGSDKDVKITVFETPLPPSYAVLLCSDGLWEYVSDDEMRRSLFSDDAQTAVQRLVALAKERGGSEGDNISVVVHRSAPTSAVQKVRHFLSRELW